MESTALLSLLNQSLWQGLPVVLAGLAGFLYTRGWLRLRRRLPELSQLRRLLFFWLGLAALMAVHLPPLIEWSEQLLFARSIAKILTVMLAPPLLWLAIPVHVMLLGLPKSWRRQGVRLLFMASPARSALRAITAPGLAWLLFISAFLIWHDTRFASWSMQHLWSRHLTLWLLLLTALLYWGHVVGASPRIHERLPNWVFFAYLIGADIPNMVSGVTISFSGQPIYSYYIAAHAANGNLLGLDAINDQIIAGGLVWFFGSMVYFGSAVLVIGRSFKHDSPQPFPNWDADERMIAPGLEHRLTDKRDNRG
jgi:cytochrome c oxidase assembly factor CtaG